MSVVASNVPPPKSYTTAAHPTGTSCPVAASRCAAATGSATSRGTAIPARAAAPVSTARRCAPHAAGCVSTTSRAASPGASATTRASTAATISSTGTSRAPSSSTPSSTRRFGHGSKASARLAPHCTASRPVWIRSSAAQTADGSSGNPSNSSARTSPSGVDTAAAVFDVPKSILSPTAHNIAPPPHPHRPAETTFVLHKRRPNG